MTYPNIDVNSPKPPTDKQEWLLRKNGQWRQGMTFQEAWDLISEIKKREEEERLGYDLPPPRTSFRSNTPNGKPAPAGCVSNESNSQRPPVVSDLARQILGLNRQDLLGLLCQLLYESRGTG